MIDWNDNISDEMLAAYLDGNANTEECSLIQTQVGNDSMLSEVIDIVNDINHIELTMGNDNLILNPVDTNMDWNNGMDMLSTPLLDFPDYNDNFSLDSFDNGFEKADYKNDFDNLSDNITEE